jgi:hypothetical protein
LPHPGSEVSVRFDDPNLVESAGLLPLVRLVQRCGVERSTKNRSHRRTRRNAAVLIAAVAHFSDLGDTGTAALGSR